MAVAAMLAGLAAGAAHAGEKLVLQLHGPAQFRFAGYYAALWQGYYRDAGFDVEIRPGEAKPGAPPGETALDPVGEVVAQQAHFATGTAELFLRAAQGQPILLLAPIFQHSGIAAYSRADDGFSSLAALAKARLGRLPASDMIDVEVAAALRAENVDLAEGERVPLRRGESAAALAERRVDAVPGSAWELPWLAREIGIAVKPIDRTDPRADFYGDSLFTSQRFARAEPQTVNRFRAASLKGWQYALRYPDEIGARLLSELPRPPGIADAGGFTRYQARVAALLADFPAVPLGHSDPERWRRMRQSLLAAGALMGGADPAAFVFDPEANPRSRADRYGPAIAGAVALTLAAAALLWRRRRRAARPVFAAVNRATLPERTFAGAPQSDVRPTDLNAELARIDRQMRRLAPRRTSFRTSLLPDLWRCRAEPETVRRLVLELLAAAASDIERAPGGTVRELVVGTRNLAVDADAAAATPGARTGEFARLTVRDSGPGLSDEALDSVLDPAVSVRPAAPAAARLLRPLGGFVRVESAEGVGTAVHLYFRRAEGAAEPAAPAQAAD
jgi:ABC-type nitrate/sulfonate/bicarbonate transport system substrate-binding protein